MKPSMLVLRKARVHEEVRRHVSYLAAIMECHQLCKANTSLYDRVLAVRKGASKEEWISASRFMLSPDPVDALGVFSEPAEYIGVQVADALGFPHQPCEVVERTHNKFLMRKVLKDAGLDDTLCLQLSPPFKGQLQKALQTHGPLIVKPLDARASAGVSRIEREEDIERALRWFETGGRSDMLVESYLEGEEFSVETFSEGGACTCLAITKNYKEKVHFIEVGHVVPALLDKATTETIKLYVQKVLHALGVEYGPAHTEIIVTKNGPRIVETHLRVAGDYIERLVALVTGINLHDLWVRQTLGQKVAEDLKEVPPSCVAGIRYILPSQPGTVKAIEGLCEAKGCPGVDDVIFSIKEGENVGEVTNSFARGGAVIAHGKTHTELSARLQNALSHINICME